MSIKTYIFEAAGFDPVKAIASAAQSHQYDMSQDGENISDEDAIDEILASIEEKDDVHWLDGKEKEVVLDWINEHSPSDIKEKILKEMKK